LTDDEITNTKANTVYWRPNTTGAAAASEAARLAAKNKNND